MKNFRLGIILILLLFSFCNKKDNVDENSTKIIFQNGFESGKLDNSVWDVTWWTPSGQLEQGIEPEIVTSPVRSGKYAVKIRAQYNWNGIKNYTRTELQGKRNDTGKHITFFYPDHEYWIKFSVYLPNDWKIDTKSQEVIFQLHGNDNPKRSIDIPSLALFVDGDTWYWGVAYEQPTEMTSHIIYAKTKLITGKWVDFVIHAKFSYKNNNTGFLEVWRDGTSLFTRNGPNCYNDDLKIRGPQTGIYKWDWSDSKTFDVSERVIFLDDFKVIEGVSTYEDFVNQESEN